MPARSPRDDSSPGRRRNEHGMASAAATSDGRPAEPAEGPCAWFARMIDHCCQYAAAAKAAGRPVVGILCEYTPRELIMAAGGVPVCLCGGSAKTIPAAEQHLPANLCPLIKSTYGYHVLRSNPFLEMADLVVGETTCDGKKKMYELMAESRPMYVLELPHKAADAEALDIGCGNWSEFRAFLSQRLPRKISDDKLREAIRAVEPRAGAAAAIGRADEVGPSAACSAGNCSTARAASGACPPHSNSMQNILACRRHKTSTGPAHGNGSRRVRVLMTGVPMVHGAERVLDIVEHSGGLVVAMENCTGLKPLLEDVDADGGRSAPGPGGEILPPALLRDDAQRPPARRARPAGGRLSAAVRHRADLAGLPHLRRGVAPRATFGRGRVGAAVSADRDRLFALRLRRGSPCAWRPCWRRFAPGGGSRRTRWPHENHRLQQSVRAAEWIAAHGLRPQWLRLSAATGRPLRRQWAAASVPMPEALIDAALAGLDAAALVLTTACDQMRYAAAADGDARQLPGVPAERAFHLANGRRGELYRDELATAGAVPGEARRHAPEGRAGAAMLAYDQARQTCRSGAGLSAGSLPKRWPTCGAPRSMFITAGG